MDKGNIPNASRKTISLLSLICIIFLAIAVGEYFYFHAKEVKDTQNSMISLKNGVSTGKMPRMAMVAQKSPPLSDQQTQQLAAGTNTSLTQKTFNITGGNFYFTPNKITVNKGDQVTFVMTDAGGVHDILIDEYSVRSPIVKTGSAVSVTFTASKTGSFVYYCNVQGHRQRGMFGTLTVQ